MEKQTITFKADEQGLVKTGGITNYASNTVSYIEATFVLGANWSGFDSVRAIWANDYRKVKSTVLDGSGKCIVPAEILTRTGKVTVNLVGSIVENDTVSDRLTTYPITAVIVDANARLDNDEPAVTPTQFEQFVAIVKDDADRAETAAGNADASAEQAEGYADDAEGYMQRAEAAAETAETEVGKIIHLTAFAETLSPGSSATAVYDYNSGTLTLGIPQGATGATPNITIGSVTTLDPGTPATATITGTAENPVLNLGIPKGAKGDTGVGIESIYETGTSGAVHTYTILYTDGNTTEFTVTDGEVTNASLQAILQEYAKTEGEYPDLISGNLTTSKSTTNTTPYLFRANPTKSDREYDKIVGASAAVNQLASLDVNDYTLVASALTKDANNVFTLASDTNTSTPKYARIKVASNNHVYFLGGYSKADGTATTARIGLFDTLGTYRGGYDGGTAGGTGYNIVKAQADTDYIAMRLNNAAPSGSGASYKNVQVIDLTAYFGSTSIPDRAYTLESGTAGAGIAWLKSYGFFTKPYYPYNAGALQSTKTSKHKMIGFNLLETDNVSGTYTSYTNSMSQANRESFIAQLKKLQKLGNTFYYTVTASDSTTTGIAVGSVGLYNLTTNVKSINNNATFTLDGIDLDSIDNVIVYGKNPAASVTLSKPCISISSDRDGEYEQYSVREYTLPNTELRGIFKMDGNYNIYADGDRQKSGSTEVRYGIVDLGSLDWTRTSAWGSANTYTLTDGGASIGIKTVASSDLANLICPKYVNVTANAMYVGADMSICNNNGIRISDSTDRSADDFKTAMNGVYLIYELATPTTETTAEYDELQFVSPYGTEEYIDGRTVEIPVGHETKYPDNLKLRLEDIPDLPDTAGEYKLKVTVSGGVVSYAWV